jgi:hypothetical protein
MLSAVHSLRVVQAYSSAFFKEISSLEAGRADFHKKIRPEVEKPQKTEDYSVEKTI